MDLTESLTSGENVIGATVLYFGQGDATCPMSRAGFIFKLEIEHADGRKRNRRFGQLMALPPVAGMEAGASSHVVYARLAGRFRCPFASAGME